MQDSLRKESDNPTVSICNLSIEEALTLGDQQNLDNAKTKAKESLKKDAPAQETEEPGKGYIGK